MEQKIPEVLQDAAGAVITDRKVWEQQRGRIYELLCDQEYGFLPPPLTSVRVSVDWVPWRWFAR